MEWRYLPTGKVKHALERADDRRAVCGMELWRAENWYGTGSQDEYENCAARPACRRCLAMGARP